MPIDTPSQECPSQIGRYLVERRLGEGGMADVYLCRQVGMGGFDRRVVIKQIRPELRNREDVIAMFLDEARIAAQISHPNVVQIIEIDEADGLPYLVMEYIRGLSFEALRAALKAHGQLPPLDLVAALGAQVCAGLHAAHELCDSDGQPLSVVHRDITPANLLVTTDGMVKIIDFGIARARNRLAKTAAGHIKGRLAYLAPEMVGSGTIDRRADLFSLGVVLHEMLRGELLFDRATDVATVSAVLTGDVPRLSESRADMNPRMEELIERTLSQDPSRRPQSADELGAGLHEIAMQTGRFVTPPLLAKYLNTLLNKEISSLPRHHLPTTAKMPLPSLLPTSPRSRPTLVSKRPYEETALSTPLRVFTERVARRPRWHVPILVLLFVGSALFVWYFFSGGQPGQRRGERSALGMESNLHSLALSGGKTR